MRWSMAVLAVVACKSDDKSVPTPTPSGTKPQPSEVAPMDKPVVEGSVASERRICKRLDTDPIAKALGIDKLSRTGGGTFVQGGAEPASLICSYYEGSKTDGGMAFGFSLRATTELAKRDSLDRFKWEPFDGLGQPAQIGRGKDRVHIQLIVKGVQLETDVDQQTVPVAELEKRLVAATKALIDQLPADATAEVR